MSDRNEGSFPMFLESGSVIDDEISLIDGATRLSGYGNSSTNEEDFALFFYDESEQLVGNEKQVQQAQQVPHFLAKPVSLRCSV